MAVDPSNKRRSWSTLIRPSSSDGRTRPFAMPSFKKTASTGSPVDLPNLPTPMEDSESKFFPTSDASSDQTPPSMSLPSTNRNFIASSPSSKLNRNGRPSSSSGWLGGGARSWTLPASNESKVKQVTVPIPVKEVKVSDSSMAVDPSNKRRRWSTLVRPSSSDGTRPFTFQSFKRTVSIGSKVEVPSLPTTMEDSESKFFPTSDASSNTSPPSSFIASSPSSKLNRNGRPSSSSGWLGGGVRSLTLPASNESKVKQVTAPIPVKEVKVSDSSMAVDPSNRRRNWSTLIRPSSSDGIRPSTFSSFKRTASTGSKVGGPCLPTPMEDREIKFPLTSDATCHNPSSNATPPSASLPSSFIPSSLSSKPTRNVRPSSSSGWLGGNAHSSTMPGSKAKQVIVPILVKDVNVSDPSTSPTSPVSTHVTVPTTNTSRPADMTRTLSYDCPSSSSRSTKRKPSLLTFSLKTPQALENEAPQIVANAAEHTSSLKSPDQSKAGGSFSRSFTSMMGGLSSFSLSRTSTRDSYVDDKERGRSLGKLKRPNSASHTPSDLDSYFKRNTSRARSQSPISLRRYHTREPSPAPEALPLSQSDADLSLPTASLGPRSTAFSDDDSGDEALGIEAEADTEYGSSSDEATFDRITERNTERNALITVDSTVTAEIEDPDPVGEGVNVVVAPEPYFPTSLNTLGSMNRGKRNPRRRKSVKVHEPLPLHTSRPVFQRDRCTITITQGDPEGKLGTRKMRQYVIASDMSQESRYAVEWGIGTVIRDGDEMLIVTVVESDSKVDPPIPNPADRAAKVRSQQERQGLAYILVRQVTGLLQRTKLNVKISCQAWHAKNARHMLLDVVDHVEPTMLIVGSRGLGQLNGILLGSTSHYLIQKCSVPVMVARRRLKRPPKKSAHLSTRRTHVSLAEAGIDRVAARVDQDVQVMRDEIQKDDKRRLERRGSRNVEGFDNLTDRDVGEEEEVEDDEDIAVVNGCVGVKVAGD